ncbi:MAG: hypothetical protein A3D65_02685 [Candidatus Lloydbacteria bacterium RIFCSPHIGHO2_02_FULL_50_13]|uniref:4Fe-4S ferredoxin-type domain-containing protein n=1 Tax=Candidatus Lloydbacteria bacterium RIFCSPHIGHO2_02_FULL_50_13 TaxID=1798661 RepID=A0A1G2D3V8_9BACT|nr:MAG: hypothetical protein A3D65_02685 [Candidatus Lloydbacteria bacterium RIFCSPHIGHO2_02_FULL_50_13]
MRYAFPPDGSSEKLLTGIQALAAAPIVMSLYDAAKGRHTAGFVSGYRGSPLAALDKEFERIRERLALARVHFHHGMNEDLAATSIYGKQTLAFFPKPKYDGVYCMWYGKGPGLDRSGDVFKHANAAGTSPLGGVLAVVGDDHACKSSTMPHQSDQFFRAMRMPYLVPADVEDILRLAQYGWELSRCSGLWVGFIVVAELADASQIVSVNPYPEIIIPTMELPSGGLNIRLPDDPMEQEIRVHTYRLEMAKRFVALNNLNVVTHDTPRPSLGIVASGKSYRDTLEAFQLLGLSSDMLRDLGIRVMKVGMPWPLSLESMRGFLADLPRVLVVEEKQNVIEDQLKAGLYNLFFKRLTIVGKQTASMMPLLPEVGELTPAEIAVALLEQPLPTRSWPKEVALRAEHLRMIVKEAKKHASVIALKRLPFYCSGCPHNTSTKVPDGSVAGGGIGCHYMVLKMDSTSMGKTIGVTPMGQEGAQFIGYEKFSDMGHVFQNLGDGTYFHSGSLPIRATVSANTKLTYKILYNDAVAMTGGQKLDGTLTVPQITHQVYWEGVRRIAIVSDDISKYRGDEHFCAPGTTFHPREEMEQLERELRECDGVSVLVYDQTCAAEKRRRRKAGTLEDPPKRSFINERVCEGCGDCGLKSNCLSIEPLPTEYGMKRKINQSSCNKDYSCINGFCPSFVSVDAPRLKRKEGIEDLLMPVMASIPEPTISNNEAVHNILFAGIGGTGIVTVAQVLTTAAYLDGFAQVLGLDMTGLSQKAGYVSSHVRLGRASGCIESAKIPHGETTLLFGADLVSSVHAETLALLPPEGGRGVAVVANNHVVPTAEFTHNPDFIFPRNEIEKALFGRSSGRPMSLVDATFYAEKLFGDELFANIFLLGFAFQQGLVPVNGAKIEEALVLNGQRVKTNTQAFRAGRWAGYDLAGFTREFEAPPTLVIYSLDELIERRVAELSRYQNDAYAKRYRFLVRYVKAFEDGLSLGETLSRAVAENYYKLLAYKDEYEVARLYSEGEFERALRGTFESYENVRFELAPPLFAKKDPVTGLPRKSTYGPWIWKAMGLLAQCKFLRDTPLDPFGYTADRKEERALIVEYEQLVETVLAHVTKEKRSLSEALLRLPEMIRGYGHIKAKSIMRARARAELLVAELLNEQPVSPKSGFRKLGEIPEK